MNMQTHLWAYIFVWSFCIIGVSTKNCLKKLNCFLGKMADLTGTLWEHNGVCASLNHGFASFAGVMIAKCLKKNKIIGGKNNGKIRMER